MRALALPGSESTDLPLAGATAPAMLALQRAMSRAGWEIDFIDVDLTGEQPAATIKCHRADGLWLWAKVDTLGRCSVETFHRERWLGKPANTKGNWPMSPQVDDVFLGRRRPADARALLMDVSTYIADNATHPVSLVDMQAAWAALADTPSRAPAPMLAA
jgi:nucleotide-binding universal stress UspA family protein